MKLLSPEVNLRLIAPKRRNVGIPWFKRGTMYRNAIDVLRQSAGPMTAREIADALLAGRSHRPRGSRPLTLQAAILPALRRRNGKAVTDAGMPQSLSLTT